MDDQKMKKAAIIALKIRKIPFKLETLITG